MKVDATGVTLSSLPAACQSVDVRFDGRRVWSIALEQIEDSSHPRFVGWPPSLRERLVGYSEITIADSGNGKTYYQQAVQFSKENSRITITDHLGTPLSVNKWGDLAPDLADLSSGIISQLLASSRELIDVLHSLGKRPFIVGGTLLGAVREGRLLPHDDDVDIAYLSEHSNPADVAFEGFELGHKLRSLGYEFMRHSAAHIQLIFRGANGVPAYHIDIFSAFFTDDGYINQPFHVRGKMSRDQLLPFSTVHVDERAFPAPADPEAWLVINYDENWRTPIPGYRLLTPTSTVRRFENWFGAFNFRREFWDRWFQETPVGSNIWANGAEWIAEQAFRSPRILELGCGDGTLARELATLHPQKEVIAADYSPTALGKARRATMIPNVSFVHANLYRIESLGVISSDASQGSFDIVANHLFEQVAPSARATALRLMRGALRSGGSAYATSYAKPTRNLSSDDPTTWHLDRNTLIREAHALGLEASFTALSGAGKETLRHPYGVRFSLPTDSRGPQPPQLEGLTMKDRLKSLIRRNTQSELQSQVEELREQLIELQAEIDEYRRLSLRSAEILDLVEQRLNT